MYEVTSLLQTFKITVKSPFYQKLFKKSSKGTITTFGDDLWLLTKEWVFRGLDDSWHFLWERNKRYRDQQSCKSDICCEEDIGHIDKGKHFEMHYLWRSRQEFKERLSFANLFEFSKYIAELVDKDKTVNMIYLDFRIWYSFATNWFATSQSENMA